MIAGGSIHRASWVAALDPRTRLSAIAFLMVAVPFLRREWQFLGLAATILVVTLLARVRLRVILRGIGALAVLIALSFILQLFLAPGESLARWGPFDISSTGLRIGAILAGRLILLAALSALLGALISPLELAGALERLLGPLARLGLPVRRLALIIGIALRFVPQLQQEARAIFKAQRARGISPSGSLWRRAKRLPAILIPLLLNSLRRAERLAEALEARCYSEERPRSSLRSSRLTKVDLLALGAALSLALGILWL